MGGSSILIIGATGYIGRHVANAALAQGHPTFLLVRESTSSNPEKAQLLESFTSKGATLVHGSIDDYASLVEAVKVVDVVISTVGAQEIPYQFYVIWAIQAVGTIKRFFPSEFGMDWDGFSHAVESMITTSEFKVRIRETIEKEGIPYTYIVPNCFYKNGPTKAVYMQEEDVGTFTIKAVDDPRTLNKTLYLRPPANFQVGTDDVEATELYPDVMYKTVDKSM